MKKYLDLSFREEMWSLLETLLEKAHNDLWEKNDDSKKLYSSSAHYHITKNIYELFFPLPREDWPKNFLEMDRVYDDQMKWPNWTTYNYMMDCVAPPSIPSFLIHFGYAVYQGEFRKTAFFVVQHMVPYQEWPQGMVIDPIAVRDGIQPDFYIGVDTDKNNIAEWSNYRRQEHPLEHYVRIKNEKEHAERLYHSGMQSYWLQMEHEPHWFSDELIKFAEENDLHIPSPQRNEPYPRVLKKKYDYGSEKLRTHR